MDDQDPIKQLQALLDDRGKVLEKISGIHSALNSIKGITSTEPAPVMFSTGAVVSEPKPDAGGGDRVYDRLLQTLRDMQAQIEERVQPLAQQTVQVEVERLREQREKDHAGLQDCLARIDQSVLACVERLHEYQRRYAELVTLNQRVAALGAEPEVLPENSVAPDIAATINLRLQRLRLAGKA